MSRDPQEVENIIIPARHALEYVGHNEAVVLGGALGQLRAIITDRDSEAKTLKEDNAHWICKHTAAEQKYLKQSNDIAELRERVERLEKRNSALMNAMQERVEGNTLSLLGAEEREQKLKEAIQNEIEHSFSELECFKADRLHAVLATLYPLDREDTTNE